MGEEPVPGQPGGGLEGAWFLGQVGGAGDYCQLVPAARFGLGRRLRPRTVSSCPPVMSSVGAVTAASRGRVRSGRPPRDTTAAMPDPGSAAAHSAAAAPVLAPE